MKVSLRRIVVLSGVLVTGTCFLKENLNSMALIALVVLLTIYCLLNRDYQHIKKAFLVGIPLILYFVLAFLGFMLNSGSNPGYLVRLLPFLIAPLFIYYFTLENSAKTVIYSFIGFNLLFLIFLDVLAIKDMIEAHSFFVESNGKEDYRFLYTRYTGDYFNHIYLSTYTLLSIVLLIQFKPVKNRAVNMSLAGYFFIHIVLLGSRAAVIGIIISAILILLGFTILRKENIKYFLLLIAGLIISSGIIYYFRNTLLVNRYAQAFEWYNNRDLLLERDYSINNRAKIYIVGLSMFKDIERYGINGTGLASHAIHQKYKSVFKEDFSLKTETYNAHNQYINNFIDWGLIGLALTIYLLYLPVNNCFHLRYNWLGFFWLAFIIILMMESVLIRHRGIIFFILFMSLFSFQKQRIKHG